MKSKHKDLVDKTIQDIRKPQSKNPNEGWIIFYDDSSCIPTKRYYFHKMYNTLKRPRFDTNKFALFHDIIECNNTLKQLDKYLKLYNVSNIKLMAAQVTIEE